MREDSGRITVLDVVYATLIFISGLVVIAWFAGKQIIMFWDGYLPLNPVLNFSQQVGYVWEYWVGSGMFSPDYTSTLLIFLPYRVLTPVIGVAITEQLLFYLWFSLSGISMYVYVRWLFRVSEHNREAAFLSAMMYMFNWYWIDGVLQDLVMPTVLTFLPLLLYVLHRYISEISTGRKVVNKWLFYASFTTFLIPGIFYQASVAIIIFLFLYTLFLAFSLKSRIKVFLFRIFGFFLFLFLSIINSFYFVANALLTGVQSYASTGHNVYLGSLYQLTSHASFFNVLRNLQPSDFFVNPYTSNQLANFTESQPIWFLILSSIPVLLSFLWIFKWKSFPHRRLLAFILIIYVLSAVLLSGPNNYDSSMYIFLLKLPFGAILLDPIITLGFITILTASILIAASVVLVLGKISKINGTSLKRYMSLFLVAFLAVSFVLSAFPLVTGSAIPEFNSGHVLNAPTIGGEFNIPTNITNVYNNISSIAGESRTLLLPSNDGISASVFSKDNGYVSSTSLLQLKTGVDLVTWDQYGLGNATFSFFSETNELIWDNYYNNPNWYLHPYYFVNTTHYGRIAEKYGIQYILIDPNIPSLNYFTVSPEINYSMAKVFLNSQLDLKQVYSSNGYILYRVLENISPIQSLSLHMPYNVSEKNLVNSSTNQLNWMPGKNNLSAIYGTSENYIKLNFNGSITRDFFVNRLPMKISTNMYKWLNIQIEAINSKVNFYYLYENGSHYTLNGNWSTLMYSVTPVNVDQYSSTISSNNKILNLSFSTQIKSLPIFGNTTVSAFDYIYVAITPNSNLLPGQSYGVNIYSLNFSNHALNNNYVNLFQDHLTKAHINDIAPKIKYQMLSHTRYEVKIFNATGSFKITLDQTYSPYWVVKPVLNATSIEISNHTTYANYGNSWLLNATGNFTVMIYFYPQSHVFMFGLISTSSIISELVGLCILIVYHKKKNMVRQTISS